MAFCTRILENNETEANITENLIVCSMVGGDDDVDDDDDFDDVDDDAFAQEF